MAISKSGLRRAGARCVALALALASGLAWSQDKLTAVHAFPANWVYSKSFLDFVRKANEAGKGSFEITVRGGPEAMGMFEQPAAVRDGVVDMVYTACAFYAAAVPECDAVSASTIDGPTARKSGAYDAMKQAHLRRMGVFYLGWMDSGIHFHLWSSKPPKVDAQGNLDVKGVKMRGNPIYNAFLTSYLGAQVLNLPSTDLYTALERGTVDMTGWTEIGLMDANWDKFLKYRVDPEFFSTDLGVIVNATKWNSLSQKSRDILQRVAAEHEASSVKALGELRTKEFAELDKRGMKGVKLSPEAGKKFVDGARAASYARMKERMDKTGDARLYDSMVKLFAPEKK
jgi:TRAP-type C4-dicarboxylate transport system substrate-binding protein